MKLKDATRYLGSVGTLLPLILILFIADAAYACPGTQSTVVYRTRTVNSRSMPIAATVITYGGPNARCGDSDSMYTRRNVRYVAVRADRDYSPRYVAVRNVVSYRPVRQTRYVAVRDADLDDAGRYVAVSRYQTDAGYRTRYAAVRSGYRRGNGIVGYVDVDNSAPRYVAVRTVPVYERRYVAVRNMDDDDDYVMPQRRYVAVRNVNTDCTCGAALQGSLDQVETVRPRHVVVKTDELAGTQEVIVPNTSYDDNTAYVAVPAESVNRTYAGYTNAAYLDDNDEAVIPAGYTESPCARPVAVSNCSGDLTDVRTLRYVPATYDNDLDDQAILDTDDATYVADNDIADACLRPEAYYEESPQVMTTQEVNYVPASYVDEDASLSGSGTTYLAVDDPGPAAVTYVPVTYYGDSDVDDDTIYVSNGDVGNSCSCPVALNTIDSNADMSEVNYVPASSVEDLNAAAVNYVPDEDADIDIDAASSAPVVYSDVDTVAAVPDEGEPSVETAAIENDASPTVITSEVTEPMEAAYDTAPIVADTDSDAVASMVSTEQIGGDTGYTDGLEAGKATALRMEQFHPGDSVDFQNGTVGYEDTYGDIDVYRNAYRSSYLQGYSEGFNSIVAAG